jgi:hypothetical protein
MIGSQMIEFTISVIGVSIDPIETDTFDSAVASDR